MTTSRDRRRARSRTARCRSAGRSLSRRVSAGLVATAAAGVATGDTAAGTAALRAAADIFAGADAAVTLRRRRSRTLRQPRHGSGRATAVAHPPGVTPPDDDDAPDIPGGPPHPYYGGPTAPIYAPPRRRRAIAAATAAAAARSAARPTVTAAGRAGRSQTGGDARLPDRLGARPMDQRRGAAGGAELVSPAGGRDQTNLRLFVPRHERRSERAYFRARFRQCARHRRIHARRRPQGHACNTAGTARRRSKAFCTTCRPRPAMSSPRCWRPAPTSITTITFTSI